MTAPSSAGPFLGIDVGTSSVKLSLIDASLGQVASAAAPLTVETPKPYWSEQAPAAWWDALVAAMAQLHREAPAAREAAAIGLSGQMHGAVLLDASDAVIRPAILWNDGRSFAEAAVLAERVPDIGHVAGVPPLPGFTAPKVMWLKTNEPDRYAALAGVLLPKDYLGLRLHGGRATDKSDAAGTLWLDERSREWSAALAAASETDPAWLPEALEGTAVAGALRAAAAEALGLASGIPVVAGGADAATGAVGVGAVRDGAAFLSLGTSGQLFVATDDFRPHPEAMVHAFAHAVPGLWFQMACMLNGARPLSWFAAIAGAPVETLLEEAAGVEPATAPLFLPYLTGERSPHGDPHIRGAFAGLADGTGRAAMMRAIVNAVAFSFADAADSLRAAGTALTAPLAIGGGARSDLLLQTLADVLAIPVRRGAAAETGPAFGAARLAAAGVGACTLADLATEPAVERVFEPAPRAALDEGLARYRALYRALKPLSAPAG